METITPTYDPMLSNVFLQALSYPEFFNLTAKMASESNTTGPVKSETRIHATQLNLQRLKRLNKTTSLLPIWDNLSVKETTKLHWLVIAETWCGDAAQILPVIYKIAEKLNIQLSIVLRDEHLELADRFLFRGTRSIPMLICFDEEKQTKKGVWGPRPAAATDLVDKAKVAGIAHDDYVISLQNWYNQDKTVSLQNELFSFVNDCLNK